MEGVGLVADEVGGSVAMAEAAEVWVMVEATEV